MKYPRSWSKVNLAKWFLSPQWTSMVHFWKQTVFSALFLPTTSAALLKCATFFLNSWINWDLYFRVMRTPFGCYCSAISSLIVPAFPLHLQVSCFNPKISEIFSKGAKLLITQTDSSTLTRLNRSAHCLRRASLSWFLSQSR